MPAPCPSSSSNQDSGKPRRELLEETGLHVTDLELFWSDVSPDADFHWHIYCAATDAHQDDIVVGEGAAMVFLRPEAIAELPVADNVVAIVRRFLTSDQYRRLAQRP